MAYTPAPETQTYNSHKLPVTYSFSPRLGAASSWLTTQSGMPDGYLMNLIPRKDVINGQELSYVETRPPVLGSTVNTAVGIVRGCYVWEKSSSAIYYYAVFGNKVYTSTNATTWTAVTTLNTSTNPVGFTEFINDTNTKYLILVDGEDGYVFTSNAAGTLITDGDFPTPHLPFPVFIDGYLFLAKADTGDIYNSDLNDPTAWTAGSFISSELYPDDVKAIVKINNYLVAVGSIGCEYFYDAANATASPLQRDPGLSLPFGTPAPFSIASNKNTLMFFANNSDGDISLKYVENTKSTDISCEWLIDAINYYITLTSANLDAIRCYFVRINGELGYVVAFDSGAGTCGPAFMYLLNAKTWVRLSGGGSDDLWPATYAASGTSTDPVTFLCGKPPGSTTTGWFGKFGISTLNSSLYENVAGDDLLATGASTAFKCTVQTPSLDFDTLNRKSMHRLGVDAAFVPNDVATTVDFEVSVTDDDYQTYSTARTISYAFNSDDTGFQFPFLTQLGMFRRRAINVSWESLCFTKLRKIETDINKGQQ